MELGDVSFISFLCVVNKIECGVPCIEEENRSFVIRIWVFLVNLQHTLYYSFLCDSQHVPLFEVLNDKHQFFLNLLGIRPCISRVNFGSMVLVELQKISSMLRHFGVAVIPQSKKSILVQKMICLFSVP